MGSEVRTIQFMREVIVLEALKEDDYPIGYIKVYYKPMTGTTPEASA